MNDSLVPSRDDYEHRLLGWFKEAVEESDAFLHAQRGYNRIGDTINAVMSESSDLRSSSLSSVSSNHVGKIAEDLVSGLTEIKPFWEFKTGNQRYEKHTEIYGKCSQHVWLQAMLDMKFADVVKYSLAGGTGRRLDLRRRRDVSRRTPQTSSHRSGLFRCLSDLSW